MPATNKRGRPSSSGAGDEEEAHKDKEIKLGVWDESDIKEAKAVALGREQRAGLSRAEVIAEQYLKDDTRIPTANEVEKVLEAIGSDKDWPKQTRPNLADAPVSGMCLGLVFGLGGGGAKVSLVSENYPAITAFIVKWCLATLPKTKRGKDFPFSSIQVNFNYGAKKHVDGNNIGPSYIQSLGQHSGGTLWTEDQGVVNCRRKWCLFNGNLMHETQPFKGTRISFIPFTHGLYNKLTAPVKKELLRLGFNAARSDGKDLEFFERFRIEKNYLTEEHNDKFREFREQRQAEGMPPPAYRGAVAVECYGRQAERGGGWVSFVTSASSKTTQPETIQLSPNTTGIWLTTLEPDVAASTSSTCFRLKEHRQFNLYKDLAKSTTDFGKYVDALQDGVVTIVSIADTACAKSRPLGPKVYATLSKLGAPSSMEPILYRQAWALIGYKGAQEGTAIQRMGTRSTLLRLEAAFECKGAKKGYVTRIMNCKEDQTSIIDVVTGGGQDCA